MALLCEFVVKSDKKLSFYLIVSKECLPLQR